MKLKDLGYALIGALTSTKYEARSKAFEANFKESMISAHRKWVDQKAQQQNNFKKRGEALRQLAENNLDREERCNHRKGGGGVKGLVNGTGDSTQYSVIKHTHRNGDTHIHCLRCPKVWMPGDPEYYRALNFQTDNFPSTDVLVASQLENGIITGDFAEAFRKWTNARPYAGIAFSPTKGIAEATRLAEELQSTYPKEKRPVVIHKEYIPTLVKTEAPAKDDNPKFNVVNVRESLVS